MTSSCFACYIVCVSVIFCFCTIISLADSDNLQDTCPTSSLEKQTFFINGFPCKNPNNISAPDFKTSKLIQPGDTDNFFGSAVNLLTAAEFPGLNTLGLSIARTDLRVDGLVRLHSHPRASEMFFVSKGIVLAGFIDTLNQPFQTILKEGDVFVFPRGLLHFCLNAGYDIATGLSVFNSQNPGVVSISDAMFEPKPDLIKKLTKGTVTGHLRNATPSEFSSF
ncbi:germin-like protein subfamily 3 member 4 [Argentina anserina]|uniref:germin-like protein subfamily 3 member 4 n=1 Tax=Argentina anserina TaxID=57926 RepID=UPI0021768CFF|nr:germin-like protein subfamily 3 member 4 [Potentilla anserina]